MDVPAVIDLAHKVRATVVWLHDTINGIVENPEPTRVVAVLSDKGCTFVAWVDGAEIGKIIGKQGRTARAFRQILLARGGNDGMVYNLDLRKAEERDPLATGDEIHHPNPAERMGVASVRA